MKRLPEHIDNCGACPFLRSEKIFFGDGEIPGLGEKLMCQLILLSVNLSDVHKKVLPDCPLEDAYNQRKPLPPQEKKTVRADQVCERFKKPTEEGKILEPTVNFPTPPSWLRFFVPWFVLRFIDKHWGVCWSEIVSWKLGYCTDSDWNPCDTCFKGFPDGWDYCNKFPNKGEVWWRHNK